jgi:hypothetical protein
MNIKRLCVFLIIGSIAFSSFAQIVECKKIEAGFVPLLPSNSVEKTEEGTVLFGIEEGDVIFQIKAVLNAIGLKNDTVVLKTNVKISLLGPANLKASLIESKGRLSPLVSQIVLFFTI